MEDGILLISTKLKIASDILQFPLPYKYTVYSPKTRNATDRNQVYEFIDSEHGKIINRVLLPEHFKKQQGYILTV